jgi:small subunit ribosomal protein S1
MISSEQRPDEANTTPQGGDAPPQETPTAHADAPVHEPAEAAPTGHADGADTEGAEEEGDGGGAEDDKGGPAAAGAAPGAPGARKKRRRRRKKKGDGHAAGSDAAKGEGSDAEGGEGEGAHAEGKEEGGAKKDRGNNKKKDKPREPRERPAFNVGDIVFGKITEITDDVLFVDLSGKGRAVFDRRELDLPDDLEYGADPEALDEEPLAPEATEAAAEVSGEAQEAPQETPAEQPAEAAPPVRRIVTAESIAQAVASNAAAEGGAPVAEEPGPEPIAAAPEAGDPAAAPPIEAAPAATKTDFPVVTLEVGAQFIGIVHNDGGRGGLVVLTRHPKRQERAKLVVGGAFKEKGEIFGIVTGVIKGGVEVDIDGLRAFAPGSHMDLRLGADLHHLLGRRLPFIVTQYAKRGRDVVLSRKTFLEAEARVAREEALKTLPIGQVVEATVRSVVGFGAFLDVGGIEGLVPLSEMSHNRGDGPHDVFKVGEKTPVKIVKVDERGKVWLSRKAAIPDPWLEVAKKYPVGAKLTGKVVRLQPFGAFIELEPGIDGLIHTADLSMKRIEHPNEVVKEGDPIEVVVVHLEVGNHRIGLHPAPTGDAANETPQRVILNKPVKVAVVGWEANGLIVRVLGATGRHARGFITAASTGTPRGTDLRREFPLNKQLDAKVLEMDPRKGELKLSIKALSEDTERTAYRQYREQVTRESKFGTFGDLLKKNLQK